MIVMKKMNVKATPEFVDLFKNSKLNSHKEFIYYFIEQNGPAPEK